MLRRFVGEGSSNRTLRVMAQAIRSAKVGPRRPNGFDVLWWGRRCSFRFRIQGGWSGLPRMLLAAISFQSPLIVVRISETDKGLTQSSSRHLHVHESESRKVGNREDEQDDRQHETHSDFGDSRQ